MRKLIYKILKLTILSFVTVTIITMSFSILKIDGVSLNRRIVSKFSEIKSGDEGYSLQRFRNVYNYRNIDILFCGSSHSYIGFDTSYFSSIGLKSFNLGTKAQTPLNTYFLLKEHIERLSPKLIIHELYPKILTVDGYESFLDIAVNSNFSTNIIEMAIALKNINAFRSLSDIYLGRLKEPLDMVIQEVEDGSSRYVEGGYCNHGSNPREKSDLNPEEIKFVPLNIQLNYIGKIIELSKKNKSDVLFVIHPLPSDTIKRIKNYNKLSNELKEYIENLGSNLIDFNYRTNLDPYFDFNDENHLNHSGVIKFNKNLVEFLKSNDKYKFLF